MKKLIIIASILSACCASAERFGSINRETDLITRPELNKIYSGTDSNTIAYINEDFISIAEITFLTPYYECTHVIGTTAWGVGDKFYYDGVANANYVYTNPAVAFDLLQDMNTLAWRIDTQEDWAHKERYAPLLYTIGEGHNSNFQRHEPVLTNVIKNIDGSNVTLAGAAAAGGFAGTETITPLNIVMGGYWQALVVEGIGESTIDSTAYGASQSGYSYGDQSIGGRAYGASQSGYNDGTQSIGNYAYGASQSGYNEYGDRSVGNNAIGASQSGYNDGTQSIGNNAYGASQSGKNNGTQSIGNYAYGAIQAGSVAYNASAINNAVGAMQLLYLTSSQTALTTADGKGSILLGAGVASNKNAIVAGDGNVSHGDGSVTANSFWQNNTRVATIDDIPETPDVTAQYSAWTTNVIAASGTNVITSAWGNQPRLELTDAGVIDFDFGTANSGLHRLTLSLWSGTHSVTWLTNNVDFAEAPELSTNAYNTILIRKTGMSKAEGRQL